MVSKSTNPPEGFYLDPTGMALPSLGSFSSPAAGNTTSQAEDPSKKIRKPYTITKSRESWTEPEHDKFLEALQLFDRDWKKIEAFVGSKTVIQIRSHAQKYFLKAQKSGTNEHLPPPRPKRKAAHPYPQKATKIAPVAPQDLSQFQAPLAVADTGYVMRPDHSVPLKNHDSASVPAPTDKPLSSTFSHVTRVEDRRGQVEDRWGQWMPNINPCGSNESTPRLRPTVLPDFTQVYSFIGSVFDPNEMGHLQKLKLMDPIDIETVLLLMRNLSINLASPDFEDHRSILSSYEIEPEKDNALGVTDPVLVSHSGEAT